jgi:hypothetical protein
MISGLGHWGENYIAEASCHCMKVWSVVVQRELNILLECLLVCNLVVMKCTAAITVTAWGYFGIFLHGENFWRTVFDEAEQETLQSCFK